MLSKALTSAEIAAVAGVSHACMRKRILRNGIRPVRVAGTTNLYSGEAVAGLCYPARIRSIKLASDVDAGHTDDAGVEPRRKGQA